MQQAEANDIADRQALGDHGGRAANFELLRAADVAVTISALRQSYDPAVFAWLALDVCDIVAALHQAQLLDDRNVLSTTWFADPTADATTPGRLASNLTPRRWQATAGLLDGMLESFAQNSPFLQMLTELQLPQEPWIAVGRAACCLLADRHRSKDLVNVFRSLAVENNAPDELGLNQREDSKRLGPATDSRPPATNYPHLPTRPATSQTHRRQLPAAQICGLALLSCAAEFGSREMVNISLRILRESQYDFSFRDQRLVALASSRAARRQLDWQLRETTLTRCIDDYRVPVRVVSQRLEELLDLWEESGRGQSTDAIADSMIRRALVDAPTGKKRVVGDDDWTTDPEDSPAATLRDSQDDEAQLLSR